MGKILGRYLMPHPPIIIPEIGQGEESKVQATVDSMREISKQIKRIKAKTIVIITPHGPVFKDAIAISDVEKISGDFGKFGNVGIGLKKDINTKLTKKIIQDLLDKNISVAPINNESKSKYNIDLELDHGVLVPLYYIDKEYSDYNIVHITYGILSKTELYKVGIIIKNAICELDQDAIVIASGDLSHKLKDSGPYEYNENGEKFDKQLLSLLENGDSEGVFNMDKKIIEQAGECGLRSVYILLGTLDSCKFQGELLSYEGTFGVGYGVMTIRELDSEKSLLEDIKNIDKEERIDSKKSNNPYVNLARQSLEFFLNNKKHIEVPNKTPPKMLEDKRGVFVTYYINGNLRGCIGTISPVTDNIAKEIIRNAVEAGTRDPRFHPINLEELPFLEISVDELMSPEKADFEDLDPKHYGVIVKTATKSGLLLPDLDGVDTREEQLSIALQKAGIRPDENYIIERFKVVRHI